MDSCDLGGIIKEERKSKKITQRELAVLIGVDFSYISKIENGNSQTPSKEVLTKIANTLEIDQELLFIKGGQVPEDIKEIIFNKPGIVKFLRGIKDKEISKDQWEGIYDFIEH